LSGTQSNSAGTGGATFLPVPQSERQSTGHPHYSRQTERRQEGDYRSIRNPNHLYPLKVSLVGHALSVIPTNLIFEPLHNGIDFGAFVAPVLIGCRF
jgi:hypothetical protein